MVISDLECCTFTVDALYSLRFHALIQAFMYLHTHTYITKQLKENNIQIINLNVKRKRNMMHEQRKHTWGKKKETNINGRNISGRKEKKRKKKNRCNAVASCFDDQKVQCLVQLVQFIATFSFCVLTTSAANLCP